MAAYLAGRRGTRRDAVLVGITVTLTHTVGVLVLGLLVTVFTSLAPEPCCDKQPPSAVNRLLPAPGR